MRSLLPLLAATLVACTTVPVAPYPPLPNGRWDGKMTVQNWPDVEHDGSFEVEVILSNCNGAVRVYQKNPDGSFHESPQLTVVPYVRQYIMYFVDRELNEPEGWIESQSWTLVASRSNEWGLSLSRTVLNLSLPEDAPWRSFARLGHGVLRKTSEACAEFQPV